jgi:hypothetical protein
MLRYLLPVTLLSTVAWSAPAPKNKLVYYYPLQVGDTLVYEIKTGAMTREQIEVVAAVEEKEGKRLVSMVYQSGETKRPAGKVQVSEHGLVRLAASTREFSTPHPLLKLPLKAGASWTTNLDGPVKSYKSKAIGEEEVDVPAGKFKALRVETSFVSAKERETTVSFWYAPNLGVVKSVSRVNERETVQVLKSFKPAN